MHKRIIIANLKAYLAPHDEQTWLQNIPRTNHADDRLVVLPSSLSIPHTRELLSNTTTFFGSQSCGAYGRGAYTGQIVAEDLAAYGCTYCLVGHSEQRTLNNNIEYIGDQLAQVLKAGMRPILCIGYGMRKEDGISIASLLCDEMLAIMTRAFSHEVHPTPELILAYEPHWAIGTGLTPDSEHIIHIADKLHAAAQQLLPSNRTFVVYGGSVNSHNCKELIDLPSIDGLLIGKASTNGQELQNIINLLG